MNSNNQTLKRSCTRRRVIQSTNDEATAKVLTQLKEKTQRRQAKLDLNSTQRDTSQNLVNRLETLCEQSYFYFEFRSISDTKPMNDVKSQSVIRQRKALKSRQTKKRRTHNRLSHATSKNNTNTTAMNKCYTQHTTYVILDDGEQVHSSECRIDAQQTAMNTSSRLNDELVFNVITSERRQL